MDWLQTVFVDHSPVQAVVVLSISIAVGLGLGKNGMKSNTAGGETVCYTHMTAAKKRGGVGARGREVLNK